MGRTSDFVLPGKMNIIVDGQYGSTGKGLIAARIATDNHIDIACARLSPNAGHTFYVDGNKYVTKLLPVSGILQERSTIYIGFGSVIDLSILNREMKDFDVDPNRVVIHPRAAIVTDRDLDVEKNGNGVVKIASTQSGSGAARASKIMRANPLAQGTPELNRMVKDINLKGLLDEGCNVLVETGQGFDLSLNVGLDYPHCTSIDATPSAILADFGIHPRYLGNIMMTLRTYPIRVGNPKDNNGKEIGYSGPVYDDSIELSWEDLGLTPELTTVTKRVRRIFSFSVKQVERSISYIEPTPYIS